MKIKDGYLLRNAADTNLIVPQGADGIAYARIFSLNETGAFLWRLLEKGATKETLLFALRQEYEVDEAQAQTDVTAFLQTLADAGVLEE